MTPLPHITLQAGPGVTALSTLRNPLHPTDPYDGLNCCHYTGDNPAHIAASREALARHLGISPQQMIIPRQTHSANVATITHPDHIPPLTDTDALVTTLPRIALLIHTADCVPILLNDPHAHIIAAIHAGWRGAIADITTRTIHTMTRLGAHPSRIIAAMGPAICPRCFETSPQIAAQFPPHLITYPQHPSGSPAAPRPHADIPALIRLQLIQAGIPPHHISMPPLCTHCNPHILFSARHHTINSGRITTLIIRHT